MRLERADISPYAACSRRLSLRPQRFIAERGIVEQGAPILVRFIAQVASRFGAVVTQKVAAQALPIVGALGGAVVNLACLSTTFRRWHEVIFTVRRLQRTYRQSLFGRSMNELPKNWKPAGPVDADALRRNEVEAFPFRWSLFQRRLSIRPGCRQDPARCGALRKRTRSPSVANGNGESD